MKPRLAREWYLTIIFSIWMKYITALLCAYILSGSLSSQSYFEFPGEGWSQTLLFYEWTGQYFAMHVSELSYQGDSTINSTTYSILGPAFGKLFTRNENGKIYLLENPSSPPFTENLLFDFSLEVGDTAHNIYQLETETLIVIQKQRIVNQARDSVWYMEIVIEGTYPDTVRWLEGIGDLQAGLIKVFWIDGGVNHICTRNKNNQTLFASPNAAHDCNCDYIHGADMDQDGYRNHNPVWKYIELYQWPPSFIKNTKHRACDTLVILNATGYSVDAINEDTGEFIDPDSTSGSWEELYYFNLSGVKNLLITHQEADIYYNVSITECETNDCNDLDSTVHVSHIEIPYNGIDNDCNPNTPDDDLDMDGFLLAEDCNDENHTIHPGAIEIPNNGIDEDCDGNDLITSTHTLSNSTISIYPNPSSGAISITCTFEDPFHVILYDLTGKIILSKTASKKIMTDNLNAGTYFLEIKDPDTNQKIISKLVVNQ